MAIDFVATGELRREGGKWFPYDLIGSVVLAVDFVAILSISVLCAVAYGTYLGSVSNEVRDAFAIGMLFAALFVLLARSRQMYEPLALLRPLWQAGNVLVLWFAIVCFLTLIGFALRMGQTVSRGATISFIVVGAGVVCGLRLVWHGFLLRAQSKGTFAQRRVVLIGDGTQLDQSRLVSRLYAFGITVVATVRLPDGEEAKKQAFDAVVTDVVASLRGSRVQEILVVQDGTGLELVQRLIAGLRILPLPIKLVLDDRLADLVSRPVRQLGRHVAVELHRAPMTMAERGLKRALDICIATSGLLLIAPLLAMTALAIRLDSPGPILFRQTRNGFNNRPFLILKFRSMRVMENGGVIRQASREDNRVTRVGRWIRRLSIDELPQLWNVVRGEMSIVGPRPHALAHDAHYETMIGDYPYRQHVKPGLTGWAQVNGSRGETPTIESMAERVRLDIWYVEHSSIWLDIRIIVRTFGTLLNIKHTY